MYRLLCASAVMVMLWGLISCRDNGPHQQDEDPKAAQEKYAQASQYNVQLGLAYLEQGDRPRAKRKLLKALHLNPHSAEAYGAMAYFLEKSGDDDLASRHYQRALSLSPRKGAPLNNYGAFLCRRGRYKEADDYFMRAAHDPRYVNTASAYENAGLCAEANKDNVKARRYFIKALDQDPRRKTVLYALTGLAMKTGEPAVALNDLKTYHASVLQDTTLLNLGIKLAQQLHEPAVEAAYRERLNALSEQTV